MAVLLRNPATINDRGDVFGNSTGERLEANSRRIDVREPWAEIGRAFRQRRTNDAQPT
jgi:hypothetical protein